MHTSCQLHVGDLVRSKNSRFSGKDWKVKELIAEKSLVHLKNNKGMNFWVDMRDVQVQTPANS